MRGAFLVCKKEFLELSKDKRTLFFTFVLPILLWPLIFLMMLKLNQKDINHRNARASRILLVDPGNLLTPRLGADSRRFKIAESPGGDSAQALRDRKVDLLVEVEAEALQKRDQQATFSIRVQVDESEAASGLALRRFREVVREMDRELVASRLQVLHAPTQLAEPSRITTTDVADRGLEMGKLLGSLLPYLLLIMMYSGSMQHGIYVTAGEKERGTLQTLLATRLPRNQIIWGKLIYVFSMGLVAASLNLISMGFSLSRLAAAAAHPAGSGISSQAGSAFVMVSPATLLLTFLLMIPLGLLFANFILFMGIQAKNTIEAGTALAPGIFVVLFLGLFSMAPGVERMSWVVFVPVMNVSLVIRKLFSQQGNALEYLLAFLMTTGLAALMTWVSTRLLDRESALFKQG